MHKISFSRRLQILILIALISGLLAFLGYRTWKKPATLASENTIESCKVLMDTIVEIRIDGWGTEGSLRAAFQEMERLEGILSRFMENSSVAKVNRAAGLWVEVDPILIDLLSLALEVAEISGGAFDPTIGAVLDLWGFGGDLQKVPEPEKLGQVLQSVDYTRVELDLTGNRVRIPRDTVLDLGGIAKGYIVDQAAKILRAAQVEHAIINAGGDLVVIGSRLDGKPWRVGVQDPIQPSEIRWVLALENQSVVTSGDYQRFFVEDGQKWHHLLDPRTGYPAQSLRSVSVISNNAAYGDALATAIFVLGFDLGRQLVESLSQVEAILVASGEVWISSGLDLQ